MATWALPHIQRECAGDVMRVPNVPNDLSGNRVEIVQMRGINWSDATQNGDLRDGQNLSAHRWPYITARKGRAKQETYSGATALTAYDKLIVVQGTSLLYDGKVVGTVTEGEKQFAAVNTKMVIWPDKVYLDMQTNTVQPLGADMTGTGATFTTNTMTVSGWGDLTTKFKAGDCITISGCTAETGNNKDIVIKAITDTVITVKDDGFTEATETGSVTLERKIPDMDFICESENRLWGCSSNAQTVYASSLGDPTNFYTFEGLSTDSYALAVGTEGAFTGCCKLSSSVLFWKETKLHKMLGSYPAEYSMYAYEMEGLQGGCHKSQQVINDTLFYKGVHGVYAYSGGTPSRISDSFGERELSEVVAGTDGESYYISAKDGDVYRLLVYETKYGIWVPEDDVRARDFARVGKKLYMLGTDGYIYLIDGEDTPDKLPWMAQFTPMYETLQGRKTYSKLLLRLELPKGSYVTVRARFDGKTWMDVGRAVGKDNDVIPMRISTNRCDKFELRLEGVGACSVLGISREFTLGSDIG